jgi:hypothetical protein
MIIKLAKRYLLPLFIVATFMGVFHHHNDLKTHNDCQICTIQSNIANADTPVTPTYVTKLYHSTLAPLLLATKSFLSNFNATYNSRAPPLA